jgi:hypothetical protein
MLSAPARSPHSDGEAAVSRVRRSQPFYADTRFRLHGPHSMLDLTRLLYGAHASLGEPYRGYSNPFNRTPNALKYEWTQLKTTTLSQAWNLLPAGGGAIASRPPSRSLVLVRPRSSDLSVITCVLTPSTSRFPVSRAHAGSHVKLVVEVGSFIGRSSALIAEFLRARAASVGAAAPPLLCIDTWLGDAGMSLGQTYPAEMGRVHVATLP